MCGIAGYLGGSTRDAEAMGARARAMIEAIRHRGPDSSGIWVDGETGVAFGHRRLAIVDLTAAGHQPMTSASGRFVIVFNGEIYNHANLRAALDASDAAPNWRGHSDTETILAGFDAWGVEGTIARAEGMFAIALWDRQARELILMRDRLGEKPLYYGWQGEGEDRAFLFGSELKSLVVHPSFQRRIDRNVLPEFLRHGHIGEDRSIYEGISKVRPGETVRLSLRAPSPERSAYWSGADIAARHGGEDRRRFARPDDAVDALETLLLEVVEQQLMSDVSVGAFLSGGIDSSTIVAMMQRLSDRPALTFSIGFHEARYNEADHAAAVAKHLGTRHTELYVGEAELLGVIPRLATIYDEPFADSSQIPTVLVARLAREQVTVALSGDGGDELFAGYDRYAQGARLLAGAGRLPSALRGLGAGVVRSVPKGVLDTMLEPLRPTPQGKEPNGQRLHRLADYLRAEGTDDLHRKLVSRWRFPEAAVPGAVPPATLLDALAPLGGNLSVIERMMQLDMLTYLPDDILTKVDRATMAVSLESRAPLLDRRVVEFAWGLPVDLKHREGVSKWVLREVLYRHVPKALIERPKMGFEVPIGLWLRGPLKDWAAAMLDQERLRREGWFDPGVIARHWDEHVTGRCNWGLQLWNVLMFQSWLETQGDAGTPDRA
jgi:asparagine synthase (glutamine-hydrolysing)